MDQVLFPAFTQCLELLAKLCGGVKASFHRSSRDTTMALSLGPFPQRLLVLGILKIVCHHTDHPIAKYTLALVRADAAYP